MIASRNTQRVCLLLGLAVWVAPLTWGQDAGSGPDPDRARVCHEKNAALRPEFDKAVSAHNSCQKSSDCAVVTPGCPFDCYVAVAKAEVSEVERRARELVSESGCRCMYKCSKVPRAFCVDGKCAIDSRR
jgi:hypothetical protein